MSGPGQKWRDYFVCRGTSALTCLLQQLTAASASPAATFAASRALAGLAANPANQSDTIKVRSLLLLLVPFWDCVDYPEHSTAPCGYAYLQHCSHMPV